MAIKRKTDGVGLSADYEHLIRRRAVSFGTACTCISWKKSVSRECLQAKNSDMIYNINTTIRQQWSERGGRVNA